MPPGPAASVTSASVWGKWTTASASTLWGHGGGGGTHLQLKHPPTLPEGPFFSPLPIPVPPQCPLCPSVSPPQCAAAGSHSPCRGAEAAGAALGVEDGLQPLALLEGQVVGLGDAWQGEGTGSAGQDGSAGVSRSRAASPPALTVLAVELHDEAAGAGFEQDETFPHRLLQRGQRAENTQEGLAGQRDGYGRGSPCLVPPPQKNGEILGVGGWGMDDRAGCCTFMRTLHRQSSRWGGGPLASYSWKKRGAKRKEAKAERDELTARRDSWGGAGHRCDTTYRTESVPPPSPSGDGRGGPQVPPPPPHFPVPRTPLSVGSR